MTRGSPLGEALWAALRAADRPLTVWELEVRLGPVAASSRHVIQRRLTGWRRAGLVAVERCEGRNAEGGREWRGWRLAHGAPASPPPVGRRGRVHASASAQERMWKAMRVLKVFDLPTLTSCAQVTDAAARHYLRFLARGDVVRRVSAPYLEAARWRLVRDTGPAAPVLSHSRDAQGVRRHTLRDRNTGLVCALAGERP